MTTQNLRALMQHLRTLGADGITDRRLLERFARQRDEAAFAEIVRRHGGLVLGVCRRLLGSQHDAEDAFQATFLVLAQKANSAGWEDSVGRWLYRTAYHVAMRARRAGARRKARERRAVSLAVPQRSEIGVREVSALLDQGLQALSARYRDVLVICCLEGQTREEAARRLGLSQRTLERRLAKGKELLGGWLSRRGVSLSATLLAAALSADGSAATIANEVASSMARTACDCLASSGAAAEGSVRAAALAEVSLRKLVGVKTTTLALGVAVSLCAVGWFVRESFRVGAIVESAAQSTPGSIQPEPRASTVKKDLFGDPLPDGAVARIGTSRFHHGGGEIISILPAPDGKTLVTNTWAGEPEVCVWEMPSGRLRYRRPGCGDVTRIGISPDGKLLATVHIEEIWIWDLASGKEVRHWAAHTGPKDPAYGPAVCCVAFSPDGKLLASSGTDLQIRFWDTKTWQQIRSVPSGREMPELQNLLLFSADSKTLIAAAWLYEWLTIWDVPTGRPRFRLQGDKGGIWSAAVSRDGKKLLTGGTHGVIPVWDLHTGKRDDIKIADKFVGVLAVAPRGDLLACSLVSESRDGSIALLDAVSGRELRRVRDVRYGMHAMAFSADSKSLICGGTDGVNHLWDVDRLVEVAPPTCSFYGVTSVALSPAGDVLLSADSAYGRRPASTRVRLSDARTGRELASVQGSSPLALSPERATLACAADDTNVAIYELSKRSLVKSLPGTRFAPTDWGKTEQLSYAANGRMLATLAMEQFSGRQSFVIRIWDVPSAKELHRFIWDGNRVDWFAISPEGTLVMAGGWSATGLLQVRVWDLATGKQLSRLATRLTAAMREEKAQQWDSSWDSIHPTAGASFSPDGRLIAIATGARDAISVWEVSSGTKRTQLKGHTRRVTCAAFSNNGRFVASAGWDHVLRFWDALTGREIQHLDTGHRGSVNALAFSGDDRLLATAADDGTCLVWRAPPPIARESKPLPRETCERLWSNLGEADGSRVQAALAGLVHGGDSSVAFLTERLRPPAPLDKRLINQLLDDLDSRQFATRERAMTELRRLGEDVIPSLRRAMTEADHSAEFASRAGGLIEELALPSPDRLREYRALEALEYIGSSGAESLLKKIAEGAVTSQVARAAAASAERLAKRTKPRP
jgi:RNA polymerase sigma factor (sigma-70 family)